MICFQIVFRLFCSSLTSFPLVVCNGPELEPLSGGCIPNTLLMLFSLALGAHPASEPLLLVSSNSPRVGDRSIELLPSIPNPESDRESGGEEIFGRIAGGEEKKDVTKEYSAVPLSRSTSINERRRASCGSFCRERSCSVGPGKATNLRVIYCLPCKRVLGRDLLFLHILTVQRLHRLRDHLLLPP